MENQTFKLSKTGIIIIVIIASIVILFGILIYVARKKQQEINKEKETEQAETDREDPEIENATGKAEIFDNELFAVFDNYRAGKYENSKAAVAASGLTRSNFYAELKKYENRK